MGLKFFLESADKAFMKTILFIIFSFVPEAEAVAQHIKGPAKCDYITSPIYIRTDECGEFCSGVIKCEYSYPMIKRHASYLVGCMPKKRGVCPSANECRNAETPRKVPFVGSPFKYKQQYIEEKPRPKKRVKPSGGGAIR